MKILEKNNIIYGMIDLNLFFIVVLLLCDIGKIRSNNTYKSYEHCFINGLDCIEIDNEIQVFTKHLTTILK